jgi:hypothetical protein
MSNFQRSGFVIKSIAVRTREKMGEERRSEGYKFLPQVECKEKKPKMRSCFS